MRKFIVSIDYDEVIAENLGKIRGKETSPGENLEREFKWLEGSGLNLDCWALVDFDDEWDSYLMYVVDWVFDHHIVPVQADIAPMSYSEWKRSAFE